jgi:hypothetical protein
MQSRLTLRIFLTLWCALSTGAAFPQSSDSFTARLDWVPISGAERNDVSGSGSATATLSRSRLSIAGTFEGLPGAATRAVLHAGVATGARGPVIGELELTRGRDGTLTGEVTLDRGQRDALLAGRLYIQIHAERGVAPDNAVLWGWLLPSTRAQR